MFDVRIIDTDSPSYSNKPPLNVLTTADNEKKRKYSKACEARHCYFTPLCLSTDGLMGSELKSLLKCLANHLSTIWELHDSLTINWIRAKLSFALLCATNLCIRGTCSKWKGVCLEDGSGINLTTIYCSFLFPLRFCFSYFCFFFLLSSYTVYTATLIRQNGGKA